jgi:hypothetical protein
VKDPNRETIVNRSLSSSFWNQIINLVGYGLANHGLFRIKAVDGIKRESISEALRFSIR